MSASNVKTFRQPPEFDEKKSFESWKNEVEIWSLVTDLDKKKHALAVTLSLAGRARDIALEIPAADLNKDDGMTTLMTALDNVFLKEEKDRAYEAYLDFDNVKRQSGVAMTDYIVDFEQKYNVMRKFNMELPDAVLAFKLLETAGLDLKDKQLALTACSKHTFADMKAALKRVFGEKSGHKAGAITVNQDAAYYTDQRRDASRAQSGRAKSPLPGTNPLDKYGRRTKCGICQSTFHWVKDCPHKKELVKLTEECESEEHPEECNITLFSKESEIFMVEALGSAVIDTACTRTVCGEKWLDSYVSGLNGADVNKIVNTSSKKPFKFGDGQVVYSTKMVKIPAKIGDTKCAIETEVVPSDIPLLLSKASLKKAGAVLNLENDTAVMFKQPIALELTSSGHYCINIQNTESPSEAYENVVLAITEGMTKEQKHKALLKLHKQFGHASTDKLNKLLSNAGNTDGECTAILADIVAKCEICLKYSRAKPKPAVGLPMASRHNETVAVDLHELEPNVWYLHIIDQFTRFSAGCIVTSKKPAVIVKAFMQYWIGVHGAPLRLYSDNGGEFNNEEVRDMAENFNIEIKTTAGYSPWSNGLLERHNQTLTEILLKVKLDKGLDWSTALIWALMAKNTMQNVNGFSPYQLVFGENPNLPSVLVDRPPALEGTTMSEWVGKHITALHEARKAFTEAECSERIRRALRKQLRPTDEKYETGDKVFYKRADCVEWKGPGIVIGQDGVVIFVRHGGTYVRVHHSRLRKVGASEDPERPGQNDTQTNMTVPENDAVPVNDDVTVPVNDAGIVPDPDITVPAVTDGNIAVPVIDAETEVNNDNRGMQIMDDGVGREMIDKGMARGQSDHDMQIHNSQGVNNEDNHQIGIRVENSLGLKTGQTISYLDNVTGVSHTAEVIGRAGKAKGKYRNWYNLRYIEPSNIAGTMGSADLGKVDNLEVTPQCSVELCSNYVEQNDVLVTEGISFDKAKQDEIGNWRKNGVFEVVQDVGQRRVSTRWVCTLKETPDGIIPKARLVARGFEEFHNKDLQKDSPTCSSESLRLLMSVICQKRWPLNSMDIKSAFLQGMELSRDIHIRPPPEAKSEGTLWKLKKCVYGLTDASLYWYNRVKATMLETGATMSQVDPAVFYWLDGECKVTGVLACHVDDFIWGGSDEFATTIIPQLKTVFQVGREEQDNFCYVGMELATVNGQVLVQQELYIKNLQPILIDPARALQRDAVLTESETDSLRSKIGQLLWVARQSRPDIMFDTCALAANLNHATVQSMHEANKVVRKLKSEHVTLKFQNLGNEDFLRLVVFSDASMGNLPDGGTQGGHLIVLMGEDGRFSPICWQSKRIRRVVRSTLAGETLALADGIDNAIFLSSLYSELSTGTIKQHTLPVMCVTDNYSLIEAIKSTKSVTEKRLRLEISGIKELIQNKKIEKILWSATKEQLADCLTKKGASALILLKALKDGQWNLDN